MTSLVRLTPLLLLVAGCSRSWTGEEKAMLQELRLVEGPTIPDPTNRYSANEEAAALGQKFFFDTRFSSNGAVSCATCHQPEKDFQDGAPLATGVGVTARRTMPLAGMDSAAWFFWDGRKDSLWSQALGPLESAVEHGGDRAQYVHLIATAYHDEYERVFGPLPELQGIPEHASPNGSEAAIDAWLSLTDAQQDSVNRVFANLGKAIAAYERKLQPGVTRFDRYVDALMSGDLEAARKQLNSEEEAGLRLFVGKASCTHCHNGPLFTNHDFANTGIPRGETEDRGRFDGAKDVLDDEFNCLGPYSDAKPETCRELRALHQDDHTVRQFKVPSLRNVAGRAPYMHAGQFATLEAVLEHYNRAPAAPAGETELTPLELGADELKQLEAFLHTLSAPLAAEERWLKNPHPQEQP